MNRTTLSSKLTKIKALRNLVGVLSLAVVIGLVSSCKKDVATTTLPGKDLGDGKRLEQRIQNFYSRMQTLQRSQPNRTAKTTDNVYISVDSAEFLIEATYNYYVAGNEDDSSIVYYNGFSFPITIANDSILSETEVAAYMQQIKDSMMAVYDTISYSNKRLALFDLEIDHTTGTFTGSINVDYSFIILPNPKPTSTSIPGNQTVAWATFSSDCGRTPYYTMFPSKYGIGATGSIYRNGYHWGTAVINFSDSPWTSPVPAVTSLNCNNPGAAVTLRNYGINNYKATYGYPTPGKLLVNIRGGSPYGISSGGASFYYNTIHRYGVTTSEPWGFNPADQFFVYAQNVSGQQSTAGKNFYTHWLNVDMMNYFLGVIPGKIDAHHTSFAPASELYDFQITMYEHYDLSSNMWTMYHNYHYYFADETGSYRANPQVDLSNFLQNP